MALWGNKNNEGGPVADVIRCDEPSYLIWKWHPKGSATGSTNRENAIRWGSSLRVKSGSLAVFVYHREGGYCEDYIMGPYDGILETNNLPVLSGILGLAYNGGTPFQAEVYFINLAEVITAKFAVPYFDCFDARFDDLPIPVAVRGTMNYKIADYSRFIALHRLDSFSTADLTNQVRDTITRTIKSVVANAPSDYDIPVTQLERRIDEISSCVEDRIGSKLVDKYAVALTDLSIAAIEVDKESAAYKRLEKLGHASTSAEMTSRKFASVTEAANVATGIRNKWVRSTAEADAEAKDIMFDQKLNAVGKASRLVSALKEDRRDDFERGMERTSAFLNGAGRNIAGGVKNIVNSGKNKDDAPPPLPVTAYYMAEKGKAVGPFDMTDLAEFVSNGKLSEDSLVWKKGMPSWVKAGEVEELAELFHSAPELPDIPDIPE